jgi:molecular chaperone DnaK
MDAWAIDLGTTNSAVARWDDDAGQPQLVELEAICRKPSGDDPLEAPRLVPSAVRMLADRRLRDRIGAWRPLATRFFIGRTALIGRQAFALSDGEPHPALAPTFKQALEDAPLRPLVRAGRRGFTPRQVARAFLRELLAEVKRTTGRRVRNLALTTPVSAFETYRAELQDIARTSGISNVRFLDEPVAAALGYGLGLEHDRIALVVDIGGGTMHVAVVRLAPAGAAQGEARVLGKQVRPLGGSAVDGWVLSAACDEMGWPLSGHEGDEDTLYWRRLMLAEACRVKEAVHFGGSASFRLVPPGATRTRTAHAPGSLLVTLTRERLADILRTNGYYRALEECLAQALRGDGAQGLREDDIEDVLLVGGSTLLPGVYPLLEERFGRRRMRAWQPFEAVAHGAACFAADRFHQHDFIVHDYAFLTHDPGSGAPQYTVIVPSGTRFPTAADVWKRQVVPTCPLGEPETLFKLLICEIARHDGQARSFVWDANGRLHKLGGEQPDSGQVIVPLNESSPTLGYLDPPHEPGDRRPRLEIAFGVNDERWLVATVVDLRTRKELLDREPVVRLV